MGRVPSRPFTSPPCQAAVLATSSLMAVSDEGEEVRVENGYTNVNPGLSAVLRQISTCPPVSEIHTDLHGSPDEAPPSGPLRWRCWRCPADQNRRQIRRAPEERRPTMTFPFPRATQAIKALPVLAAAMTLSFLTPAA